MICDPWSVVVVPFPFSDSAEIKFRPAVVLSTRDFNRWGLTVLAMITSARHSKVHGDIPVKAGTAGLPKDSIIRMKLFTLDNRLIKNRIGALTEDVGRQLGARLQVLLRLQ